ncbi:hypothetical protein UFOVP1078_5 [uncultured Caudovirales phage]|uniref:Uncharacterized protein n=1 Tax=uncultured Caudovirales phage TaxID=2100421 RepID=A0A6J5MT61_9CAUD|nr:hypothetical protein UFOVP289_16 [uncultured Caudovirales phage]CAB4150054.1 hypothetical protein UFOVP547_31 [uncultured Caudovirales phage]CAB4170007.1 hypothetical protein UFOVP900_38 [uncultured Caudovirales phage]CAB4182445.1 hypothetical protein UFOVP1078_5 [uncultured Caudovirales phage]CAB4198225.1 hypothetical protein UFOVP1317_58 [uncultured Caudovirales phage]
MALPQGPASNYPGGFNNVTIRNVPITQSHPGQVYWVSNTTTVLPGQVGGSDGNPGTFNAPFSTLEYAITRCTANRGDIIFIKPGHAETISSATALAFDVAGVAIVGLGAGTKRPTFTLGTAATTTIAVSADNVSISNCRFIGNFLSITSCFTVAAAAYFTIDNCAFTDTSAILGFLSVVKTTVSTNSDFLQVSNCFIKSDATTKSVAPIVVLNTMTGLTLSDNVVVQTVAQNNVSQFLSHAALVMTAALISGNKIYSVNTDSATGAFLVTTSATTGSGIIQNNVVRGLDVAAALMITAAAVQYGLFNNLYIGDVGFSGFVLPAIGTD